MPEAVGSRVNATSAPGGNADNRSASARANSRHAWVTFARRSAVLGSSSRIDSWCTGVPGGAEGGQPS
ncbi:hypothetical protein GCM10029963_47640 [Micromonospora andamanensis]